MTTECPELWTRTEQWNELVAFIRSRESTRRRFYRDQVGLVTISVGYLVDQNRATDAQRRRVGRLFADRHFRLFRTAGGGPVSSAQVLADWTAVYTSARTRGLLRLTTDGVESLLQDRMRGFARRMYSFRPFSRCLPAPIQMALIDTRFNPGRGNNPFTHRNNQNHRINRMWAALDPDRRANQFEPASAENTYNPTLAAELFDQHWSEVGGAVYQNRHRWRLAKFREGVATLLAQDRRDAELHAEMLRGIWNVVRDCPLGWRGILRHQRSVIRRTAGAGATPGPAGYDQH